MGAFSVNTTDTVKTYTGWDPCRQYVRFRTAKIKLIQIATALPTKCSSFTNPQKRESLSYLGYLPEQNMHLLERPIRLTLFLVDDKIVQAMHYRLDLQNIVRRLTKLFSKTIHRLNFGILLFSTGLNQKGFVQSLLVGQAGTTVICF